LLSGGVPVTAYVGGSTYTVRVKGTQSSSSFTLPNFGFQLAAVKTSTSLNAGTLTAITGTHAAFVSTVRLIEHNASMPATTGTGGIGSTYVVDIPWSAPIAGTGSVTLFGVINAVNGNGAAESGDKWNNSSLVLPEVPAPITGTTTLCAGDSTTLSSATPGGTWTSGSTGVATVALMTGVVTGVAAGTAVITYNAGLSGRATTTVTVNALPNAGTITGPSTVCVGFTSTLTNTTTGGVWSATNARATVGLTGIVTGVSTGLDTIKYTVTNGCGTAETSKTIAVLPAGACSTGASTLQSTTLNEMKVYPNPSTGTISLELNTTKTEQAHIIISNLMGEKIKEIDATTNQSVGMQMNLPTGIYFISATAAGQKYFTKVVVR
jgi:hypothetical protein